MLERLPDRWIGDGGTRWLVRLLVIHTRFDFSNNATVPHV
jgi:hypothetical protein